MKTFAIGNAIFQKRRHYIPTFDTIYGIGRTKASRLSSFLLHHPRQITGTNYQLTRIFTRSIGARFLTRIPVGKQIRLFVSRNLYKKMTIFHYQAYRIFQNLPTKGQRTKANAGTPSHLNPYLSLQISIQLYSILKVIYKKRELFNNERFDELRAFNKTLFLQKKNAKKDAKLATKTTQQMYRKNAKLQQK